MIGDILQPTHLLFILVVALLVLGPKRLPEVGRSLGKGLRDFKGAMSGIEDHTTNLMSTPDVPTATTEATAPTVTATPEPEVAVAPVQPATLPPLETVAAQVGLSSDPPSLPAHEPAASEYAD